MKGLKYLVFILLAGLAVADLFPGGGNGEKAGRYSDVQAIYADTFFDARYFSPQAEEVKSPDGRIYGAVVPHHLLAHKLIAEVFAQLQGQKPPLIILLGPNHQNKGEPILTSGWGWQTPFGIVEADAEAIAQLLRTSPVKQDDNAFRTEHSIGNLMAFIKYYLPQAKVVPIILHHDVTKEEAALLAEQLLALVKQEAVLMASVDFSHYLTREEAEEKDQETLEALQANNLGRIFTMGNDHLDSPTALGALWLTMEKLGISRFKLLDHTNSGVLLGNDLIKTTSYMTIIFQEHGNK